MSMAKRSQKGVIYYNPSKVYEGLRERSDR